MSRLSPKIAAPKVAASSCCESGKDIDHRRCRGRHYTHVDFDDGVEGRDSNSKLSKVSHARQRPRGTPEAYTLQTAPMEKPLTNTR